MEPNQPKHFSFNLSSAALLSLVGRLSDFPNPDDSNPPGKWGPVMRRAGERVYSILGPSPQPGREIFDPSPTPWRAAFAQALAQEVIDRAMQMQEVADALQQTGIIIIGGFISRFIDDCGTGRIHHSFHPPRRHGDEQFTPADLLVMAAQFEQSAAATDNEGLQREFSKASARLLDIGAGRLQSAVSRSAG